VPARTLGASTSTANAMSSADRRHSDVVASRDCGAGQCRAELAAPTRSHARGRSPPSATAPPPWPAPPAASSTPPTGRPAQRSPPQSSSPQAARRSTRQAAAFAAPARERR
jgi:hypothetical protein